MRKFSILLIICLAGFIIASCETETTKYCRIIYDGNGFTGGDRPLDTNNYTPDMKAIVLGNTYVKTGYSFKHWNTHWLGTGNSYNPGNEIIITDQYFIHLYAIWELNN